MIYHTTERTAFELYGGMQGCRYGQLLSSVSLSESSSLHTRMMIRESGDVARNFELYTSCMGNGAVTGI